MENAQLTIADLASIHSMLDAACSRGAFKAAEMTQVGQVYDKLTAFLQSIQDKSEAEPQAEPAAETQGE
jgi:hypothetical protein